MPLLQASRDNVWTLPQVNKFSKIGVFVLGSIENKDKVAFREGAWTNLLVIMEFGSRFVGFIMLYKILHTLIEVIKGK